ncbi:hypothetical protein AB0H73_06400 [Streptomyces olivoreticuli]
MSNNSSDSVWRVTALGIANTEFTYEEQALTADAAIEATYGHHGRLLRSGEVTEPLGSRSAAVQLGPEGE